MEFGRSLFSSAFHNLYFLPVLYNGHRWTGFFQREFTDAGARSCWLSSCYYERGLGELHCNKDTNVSEASLVGYCRSIQSSTPQKQGMNDSSYDNRLL